MHDYTDYEYEVFQPVLYNDNNYWEPGFYYRLGNSGHEIMGVIQSFNDPRDILPYNEETKHLVFQRVHTNTDDERRIYDSCY